jgi:hypothetical protein
MIDMEKDPIESVLIEYGVPDHLVPEVARKLNETVERANEAIQKENDDAIYIAYQSEEDPTRKAQLAARMISKGIDA